MVVADHVEIDLRRGFAEAADRLADDRSPVDRDGHADDQPPMTAGGSLVNLVHGIFDVGQDAPGRRNQHLPCGGEGNMARAAGEEAHAEAEAVAGE